MVKRNGPGSIATGSTLVGGTIVGAAAGDAVDHGTQYSNSINEQLQNLIKQTPDQLNQAYQDLDYQKIFGVNEEDLEKWIKANPKIAEGWVKAFDPKLAQELNKAGYNVDAFNHHQQQQIFIDVLRGAHEQYVNIQNQLNAGEVVSNALGGVKNDFANFWEHVGTNLHQFGAAGEGGFLGLVAAGAGLITAKIIADRKTQETSGPNGHRGK